jgi:hypothetical protein
MAIPPRNPFDVPVAPWQAIPGCSYSNCWKSHQIFGMHEDHKPAYNSWMMTASPIYHVVVGNSWVTIVLSGVFGSIIGVVGAMSVASRLFRKQRQTDISSARILRKHDLALASRRRDDDRRLAAANAQLQAAIQVNTLLNSAQATLFLAAATGDPQKQTLSFLEVDQDINAASSFASLLGKETSTAIQQLFTRPDTKRRPDESLPTLSKRLRDQSIDLGTEIQSVMTSVRELIKGFIPKVSD